MPGWVGTTTDLQRLINLFRDLEEEVRETVRSQLDRSQSVRELDEQDRLNYLDEDVRLQRVEQNLAKHRDEALKSVELSLALSEDLYYEPNDPDHVLAAASNLPATTSFSIALSTDYISRPYANSAKIILDARPSGLTCTIASTNRSFIEGTRARIARELERTKPPRAWMGSRWTVAPISVLLTLVFYISVLFAMTRIFPGDRQQALWLTVTFYIIGYIALQVFVERIWLKQFPKLEIAQDGTKPKAERASKHLWSATLWIGTSIIIPVVIGFIA